MKPEIKIFAGALGTGMLLFSSENLNAEQVQKTTTRPNIIYILADDLGYGDLSFLGQKRFKTPNIDQLAKWTGIYQPLLRFYG